MSTWFRFPNPVNEVSARVVASGVVALATLFLVTQRGWVLALLAYGFVARVLTGPTLSPLGQFATRVVTPLVSTRFHRLVPGPPKRFAQGIGAALTVAAGIAWLAGAPTVSVVLVAAVLVAASLEAALAFCLGCVIYERLMRWGLIPQSACEACHNLSLVDSR